MVFSAIFLFGNSMEIQKIFPLTLQSKIQDPILPHIDTILDINILRAIFLQKTNDCI